MTKPRPSLQNIASLIAIQGHDSSMRMVEKFSARYTPTPKLNAIHIGVLEIRPLSITKVHPVLVRLLGNVAQDTTPDSSCDRSLNFEHPPIHFILIQSAA